VQEDWEIPLVIYHDHSKFFAKFFRVNFDHYWHNSIIFSAGGYFTLGSGLFIDFSLAGLYRSR
jgi:hypothetical protein